MTAHSLPKYIDPLKLAEHNGQVSGQIAVASLTGLRDLLMDSTGILTVNLVFDRDEERFLRIQGSIEGELQLECQRCMKAMSFPLHINVSLSPVNSIDATKNLPSYYEPLMLEDETVLLSTLIEEEVMINLPMIPKHESEECHS